MLKLLRISNFAIIDNLEINFEKGFSIITGETGAGKSIMMGALSLILGEKVDFKAIRNAEKKSVIEAVFSIGEYGLERVFEANDIDYESDECIMRREILPNGRSRSFINDTPVTLPVMRSISMHLVDIHSQHSNLLLSQKSYQLGILDSIIGERGLIENYDKEYKKYTNELYGEDADEKIREAIAKDKYSKLPFKVTEEKQLFYDMISGRYFESTLMEMYRAEYELNRGYAKYGYVCLNDFYDLIGVDRVEGGYDVGWSVDASNMFYGYDCIDFEHELVILEDGLECYVLMTPFPPTADYLC